MPLSLITELSQSVSSADISGCIQLANITSIGLYTSGGAVGLIYAWLARPAYPVILIPDLRRGGNLLSSRSRRTHSVSRWRQVEGRVKAGSDGSIRRQRVTHTRC